MSRLRCSVVSLFVCCLACKAEEPAGGDTKAAADAGATAPAKADEADGGAADGAAQAEAGAKEPASADTQDEAGATETETGEELPPAPEAFDEVGVEACDEYVADYVACIDAKVPEAERDAQRRMVNENVQAWKQMASGGPSASKGLQTGCRIAREQAKRVTADWGCEW